MPVVAKTLRPCPEPIRLRRIRMDTICESPLENEPLKIYRKRAFNELSLTHKKRECKSIRGLVGGNICDRIRMPFYLTS
jgi:hypothetical protein